MKLNVLITQLRRYLKFLAVYLVAGVIIWLVANTGSVQAAPEALKITVYRDPSCSCCGGWMEHLNTQGFQVKNVLTSDMNALKQQYRVPNDLASCHTAVINGYVIEGHVPANDIKRLIAEKLNAAGIAVPGMPIGTPGMESKNVRDPFSVFSFDQKGEAEAFNQYSFYADKSVS
ncbi:MAG: DUF411 domain-containing protein [Chroococcidiopsidaceae cyanobacterium CP_BM_RX_35]|nr:DUF411 domain-containing protein [Chroococcidiopsidaceae cyanobacterium CP_BM_RX_35]